MVAQVQFACQDAVPGILDGHREAAIAMVHRGLQSLCDLECLTPLACSDWVEADNVKVALSRACEKAAIIARRRMMRARQDDDLIDDMGCPRLGYGPCNAGEKANALAIVDLEKKLSDLAVKCEENGIVGMGTRLSPAQLPGALARADVLGVDVRALLEERARLIQLHSRKGSLKRSEQRASGAARLCGSYPRLRGRLHVTAEVSAGRSLMASVFQKCGHGV